MDGGESKMMNEPVMVRIMKMIRKNRSMTSAMNRQPSLSYDEKRRENRRGNEANRFESEVNYQIILLRLALRITDVSYIANSLLNHRRIMIDRHRLEIIIQASDISFVADRSSFLLFFLLLVVAIAIAVGRLILVDGLENGARNVWLGHEDERWNDLKEESLDPVGHVMRVRMTPMDVQRENGDKDRGVDKN